MPPDTPLSEVMAHISNPSCSNAECPNGVRSARHRQQQQSQKSTVCHANSVWKAELRVRYIPKNLQDLYEKNRMTCHFYFDQVIIVSNELQHFTRCI